MGCNVLLQGIFPTQGLNPGLLHCRQMLYHVSHQGSPQTDIFQGKTVKVYWWLFQVKANCFWWSLQTGTEKRLISVTSYLPSARGSVDLLRKRSGIAATIGVIYITCTLVCESWTTKKAERQRIDAFELCCWRRLLRVPWTARRSNQSNRYAEAPILWPPDAKNWLIWKDHDAGKDWRWEKGMTEDEMVGWHHRLDGHEFG